ncbi:MAG: type II secretion system protein [Candidatus Abawacabacteria bacterium]|nr:type II secretion system protein [Candidatus Abawacabacteria bacterium]
MPKESCHIKYRGFSMLEITIAIAILASTIAGLLTGIIDAQQSTGLIGIKNQALFYTEEGLEAVRNMRDKDWNNLVDGTHGLVVASGHWTLSGTADVNGLFTREISIATESATKKLITATVAWEFAGKTGSVSLSTYLTNWMPF